MITDIQKAVLEKIRDQAELITLVSEWESRGLRERSDKYPQLLDLINELIELGHEWREFNNTSRVNAE